MILELLVLLLPGLHLGLLAPPLFLRPPLFLLPPQFRVDEGTEAAGTVIIAITAWVHGSLRVAHRRIRQCGEEAGNGQ